MRTRLAHAPALALVVILGLQTTGWGQETASDLLQQLQAKQAAIEANRAQVLELGQRYVQTDESGTRAALHGEMTRALRERAVLWDALEDTMRVLERTDSSAYETFVAQRRAVNGIVTPRGWDELFHDAMFSGADMKQLPSDFLIQGFLWPDVGRSMMEESFEIIKQQSTTLIELAGRYQAATDPAERTQLEEQLLHVAFERYGSVQQILDWYDLRRVVDPSLLANLNLPEEIQRYVERPFEGRGTIDRGPMVNGVGYRFTLPGETPTVYALGVGSFTMPIPGEYEISGFEVGGAVYPLQVVPRVAP